MSKYKKVKREIDSNGIITTTSVFFKHGILPKTTNKIVRQMGRNGYTIYSSDYGLHTVHIWPYCKKNRLLFY